MANFILSSKKTRVIFKIEILKLLLNFFYIIILFIQILLQLEYIMAITRDN